MTTDAQPADRDAFHRLVEPHLDELLAAARRDLRYHQDLGDLQSGDLTPEELVGETLLRAWDSRGARPETVSLRAWLLGTQHRVLQRLLGDEERLRTLWAVSLEAPVPTEPLYDDDEEFWEWYQPDDLARWEDVVADEDTPLPDEAIEVEALGTPDVRAAVDRLAVQPRQALLLRDRHGLTTVEVAYALRLSVTETARTVRAARREVRAAGGA